MRPCGHQSMSAWPHAIVAIGHPLYDNMPLFRNNPMLSGNNGMLSELRNALHGERLACPRALHYMSSPSIPSSSKVKPSVLVKLRTLRPPLPASNWLLCFNTTTRIVGFIYAFFFIVF